MLVGVFTVSSMWPKLPLLMSFTGPSKFGWLNKLKNCTPIPSFAVSECGMRVYFITVISVSK